MGQLERGSSRSEKVVKKLIRNACFPYVALRVSASLKEGPSSSLLASGSTVGGLFFRFSATLSLLFSRLKGIELVGSGSSSGTGFCLLGPLCNSSSAMSTVVLVSGLVAFGGPPSLAAASAGATLLLSLVLEQV